MTGAHKKVSPQIKSFATAVRCSEMPTRKQRHPQATVYLSAKPDTDGCIMDKRESRQDGAQENRSFSRGKPLCDRLRARPRSSKCKHPLCEPVVQRKSTARANICVPKTHANACSRQQAYGLGRYEATGCLDSLVCKANGCACHRGFDLSCSEVLLPIAPPCFLREVFTPTNLISQEQTPTDVFKVP